MNFEALKDYYHKLVLVFVEPLIHCEGSWVGPIGYPARDQLDMSSQNFRRDLAVSKLGMSSELALA